MLPTQEKPTNFEGKLMTFNQKSNDMVIKQIKSTFDS